MFRDLKANYAEVLSLYFGLQVSDSMTGMGWYSLTHLSSTLLCWHLRQSLLSSVYRPAAPGFLGLASVLNKKYNIFWNQSCSRKKIFRINQQRKACLSSSIYLQNSLTSFSINTEYFLLKLRVFCLSWCTNKDLLRNSWSRTCFYFYYFCLKMPLVPVRFSDQKRKKKGDNEYNSKGQVKSHHRLVTSNVWREGKPKGKELFFFFLKKCARQMKDVAIGLRK